MSYLHSIQVSLPAFQTKQSEIAEFMQNWYQTDEVNQKKIQLMYARSGIHDRYSCVDDFTGNSKQPFFNEESFPGVTERMAKYFEEAPILAAEALFKSIQYSGIDLHKFTHLIGVSCTGMAAPGLDILMIEKLGLPSDIARTCVNFMGCYAGFHAMKMAHQICQSNSNAQVLLVSVELCTLHFQKEFSFDQVASSLLFGDGAAACIVSSKMPSHQSYLKLHSFYSRLIPKGKNDMAWNISESGFLMKLSAYIPDLLKEGIADIVRHAIANAGISQSQIFHWAIHPGGKKILDELKSELQLTNQQLNASYETLSNFGNMSSATIFFVLKHILEKKSYDCNQQGFAAGFGPGLTVETMNFNI